MSADATDLYGLAVDISKAADGFLPTARRIVQKTSADIKADAQAVAPVDTGNLRSSIGYETTVDASGISAEIGPTAAYGAYVEFGTSQHGPAAYMGPAFDRRAPIMAEVLAKALELF